MDLGLAGENPIHQGHNAQGDTLAAAELFEHNTMQSAWVNAKT